MQPFETVQLCQSQIYQSPRVQNFPILFVRKDQMREESKEDCEENTNIAKVMGWWFFDQPTGQKRATMQLVGEVREQADRTT